MCKAESAGGERLVDPVVASSLSVQIVHTSVPCAGAAAKQPPGSAAVGLPEWVKARCRAAMRKPVKTMAEKLSNAREEAYRHGYLYDFDLSEYVYVGPAPEPRHAPPGRSR